MNNDIINEIEQYLKENYIGFDMLLSSKQILDDSFTSHSIPYRIIEKSMQDSLVDSKESLNDMLSRLMKEKLVKKENWIRLAGVDSDFYRLITDDETFIPSKKTLLSLAIVLHLNKMETMDLLATCSYRLQRINKRDIIIRYFIEHQVYDLEQINEVLIHYKQPLLGM